MNFRRIFTVFVPVFVLLLGGVGAWQAAPDFVAHVHLGQASYLSGRGQYQQAIDRFDMAQSEEPDLAGPVCLGKADTYLAMHDYPSALAECDEAITLGSNPASAYVVKAEIHAIEGQYETAIEESTRALNLTNGSVMVSAYYVRGMAYYRLGDSKDAASDLRIFLVLATPSNELAPTYDTLAQLYASNGQNELALQDFRKAIKLDPAYSIAYYNRGVTYRTIGDNASALADFEKVISLTSDQQLIDEANQQIKELTSAGEK